MDFWYTIKPSGQCSVSILMTFFNNNFRRFPLFHLISFVGICLFAQPQWDDHKEMFFILLNEQWKQIYALQWAQKLDFRLFAMISSQFSFTSLRKNYSQIFWMRNVTQKGRRREKKTVFVWDNPYVIWVLWYLWTIV